MQEYESEDVASKAYSKTRAAPELVVGDAPTRPKFGGKGLKSNTTYTYEGSDDGTEEMQEHEKRTGQHVEVLSATIYQLANS